MAQDFYAAFGTGADDKHIAVVDESGVALAAIQGLNQKVEEQSAQMKAKDAEIQELKTRLEKLEQVINAKNGEVK
jgi:peptidoglycan hydrolase CwlO-like protein